MTANNSLPTRKTKADLLREWDEKNRKSADLLLIILSISFVLAVAGAFYLFLKFYP